MSDFELLLVCLLIPMAYVVIYIAGKYDMITLICKMFERRCREISKEKGNTSSKYCEWHPIDEEKSIYRSECGFYDAEPTERAYQFCPYCGKKIKVEGE